MPDAVLRPRLAQTPPAVARAGGREPGARYRWGIARSRDPDLRGPRLHGLRQEANENARPDTRAEARTIRIRCLRGARPGTPAAALPRLQKRRRGADRSFPQ